MVSSFTPEDASTQVSTSFEKGVEFGENNVQYTKGRVWVEVVLGNTLVRIEALVIVTTAFEILLGMDFYSLLNGILNNPPRLIYKNQEFALIEGKGRELTHVQELTLRAWLTESYTLISPKRKEALTALKVVKVGGCLFASAANATCELYCSRENNAWWYHWGLLSGTQPWWANPPFSKLLQVLVKVILDQAHLILVTPDWKTGEHEKWRSLLDLVTTNRHILPSSPGVGVTYNLDSGKEMLDPTWSTLVSVVDARVNQVNIEVLPEDTVATVRQLSKGFSLDDLISRNPTGKSFSTIATQTPEDSVFPEDDESENPHSLNDKDAEQTPRPVGAPPLENPLSPLYVEPKSLLDKFECNESKSHDNNKDPDEKN